MYMHVVPYHEEWKSGLKTGEFKEERGGKERGLHSVEQSWGGGWHIILLDTIYHVLYIDI